MFGLRAKLDALKKEGYSVTDDEYDELIEWADVRNMLSHAPPEQYRPGPLLEQDVEEYKLLVERLMRNWQQELRARPR